MARPSVSLSVEQLVRDHAANVYRYAYHLTGNGGDAEDLTQETFARALEKQDQLRDASGARGWLLAIARSLFLKSKRRNREVSLGEGGDDLPAATDEPTFDQERLSAAIAKLPDDFRVVVL
ncbi:MAG: sigma-70 family RNA polymerase sigma factor, partial [Planctomycetota bacterium]